MSYDNPELPANMQKLEKQMTDNFGQKHKQILYEKIMSYGDNMYMMGMAEFQQHKYSTDEALFRTSEETKKEIVELINLLIVKRELEMLEKQAPAPAPKIEENNIHAWAYNYESAWHQVFDTCQNLGMKHIPECTNEEDVCAFIRTLAQRAGEDGIKMKKSKLKITRSK